MSSSGSRSSSSLAACNAIALSAAQQEELRQQNSQFPFRFTRSPRSLSATLSLPLFDGFAREQRVQEAQASSSDARSAAYDARISHVDGLLGRLFQFLKAHQLYDQSTIILVSDHGEGL